MNKYEEALNNLLGQDSDYYANDEDVKIIHEAIRKANKYDEKETPKKPTKEVNEHNDYDYICPNCKGNVNRFSKYCKECGQRIDWEK